MCSDTLLLILKIITITGRIHAIMPVVMKNDVIMEMWHCDHDFVMVSTTCGISKQGHGGEWPRL